MEGEAVRLAAVRVPDTSAVAQVKDGDDFFVVKGGDLVCKPCLSSLLSTCVRTPICFTLSFSVKRDCAFLAKKVTHILFDFGAFLAQEAATLGGQAVVRGATLEELLRRPHVHYRWGWGP